MNPTQPGKLLWLVLLAVFWAMYGLVGRDAWKDEEALALAPVLAWLHGSLSLWSAPAPLYALVAGITARLAPFALDAQDAARIASGLFSLAALSGTGLAARALYGPGYGPAAALALMGGFGLMLRAHALLPETALLAAWAILIYGIAAGPRQPRVGGVSMGLALAALTLGLRGLPDLVLGVALMLVPLASRNWRGSGYRQALKLGGGLGAGLILAGLLLVWAAGQLPGWLDGHGPVRLLVLEHPSRAFSELGWFSWPLWPLAAWAVWHTHRRLARTPELHPPLMALALLFLAALFPSWSRDGGLLPLLIPLALLAAFAVGELRRGAAQAFYWFGVLCFLFFILAFWTYFAAVEWGFPTRLANHVARLTPDYQPGSVPQGAILLAAGATLLWLVAIPLFPHAKIRPILVWATGMVLTWVLIAALFRPWVEAGWGYRPMLAAMQRQLPPGACLNAQVDPAMEVMLRYHLPAREAADCPWTLRLVTPASSEAAPAAATVVWEGRRARFKNQIYRLEHAH